MSATSSTEALLREQLSAMQDAMKELTKENAKLRFELKATLFRMYHGMRSERQKIDPKQLHLFMDGLITEAVTASVVEQEKATRKKKARRTNGRTKLPADLPRERTVLDLPEDEKKCPHCDERMTQIGEDVTETLDYVPAIFVIKETVRPKYACQCKGCRGTIKSAALPPMPVEKGRPGPGLLAHVVTSKWADHLPLYRQSKIYSRHGVNLHRSTLCDWTDVVADLLRPIVMAMWKRLKSGSYLQVDETKIRVLDVKPGKAHQGFLWAYGVPRGEVVFDFSLTRAGKNASRMLEGFRGHGQVDGYAGYDAVCARPEITRVGCMAHVRRKFVEARTEKPDEATFAIAAIQMLYRIEDTIRTASPDERRCVRQERSKLIFETLGDQLRLYEAQGALPESAFAKAVAYAKGQWQHLVHYLEVGELEIDNNWIENAIRPVALGRKNFLFCATPNGGVKAATLFSLVTSCQRFDINPWKYLRDVIDRVSTHPNDRVDELTPLGWKNARNSLDA